VATVEETMHRSLSDIAYAIIRERIIQGDFELGSRIREDEIAREIEISRTPVREATNRLVADGLILKKSQRGLFIINPDPDEINDYIDIRITLEDLSVSTCIERASDKDLQEIEAAVREFEIALNAEDFRLCNRLDQAFHSIIAHSAGNAKLRDLLEELSAVFELIRTEEKRSEPRAKNLRTLAEHREIASAIARRDIPGARDAMRKNIETMRENLRVTIGA
jgi:DNA-binding GntR family transcriptional regulator